MKRFLALLLALTLLFLFSGCYSARIPLNDVPIGNQDLILLDDTSDDAPVTVPQSLSEDTSEENPEESVPSENTSEADISSNTSLHENENAAEELPETGSFSSKEDVCLYLQQYGHLPSNYITKNEARALGWSSGSLEPYAPGKSIGGDRFGNYEGLLPEAEGRTYTECDIDTCGAASRGAKRIVFSNDGLIYYTDDHYETFALLYEGAIE